MKKVSKLLVVILCLAMVMSLFAGCGNNNPNNDSNNAQNSQQNNENDNQNTENNNQNNSEQNNNNEGNDSESDVEEIDYSEHVEYSWWLQADTYEYYTDYSENPVVRMFNKKFNTSLNFEQPAEGVAGDALNTMIATGDYTDLIEVSQYTGSLSQLYEDDVIIDIAQYLDYMPNFKALLESDDPGYKRNAYDDKGRILRLPFFKSSSGLPWAGLMYRADIIEQMTDGSPEYPSGNEEPTTIKDWDYMLSMMKEYFEMTGRQEYAALIIPSNGAFPFGDLLTSFGTGFNYYLNDGEVSFGQAEDGYYNYLNKMNEWYEKGYIYQDFASRVNDMFFLPNTSLTYGGAAGVWYGLSGQLGDALSMPDMGLEVDVKMLKNPISEENGIEKAPVFIVPDRHSDYSGPVITNECENVERLLASLDFFYSEEGGYYLSYGLTEEYAKEDPLYQELGLETGTWEYDENGEFKFKNVDHLINDLGMKLDSKLFQALYAVRLPGFHKLERVTFKVENEEEFREKKKTWDYYKKDEIKQLPLAISISEEEDTVYTNNQTKIGEFVGASAVKFIMGAKELTQGSWDEYIEQLNEYGLQENLEIQKAAYQRYLER